MTTTCSSSSSLPLRMFRRTTNPTSRKRSQLEADAGLADRLWAARESADICKQADGRSRAALYRALGHGL